MKIWRWFKVVLVLLVVGWFSISFYLGREFDKVCVEGRLSSAQAEAINNLSWGKCPKYRDGKCRAIAGDRVIKRKCSEFSRSVFMRKYYNEFMSRYYKMFL